MTLALKPRADSIMSLAEARTTPEPVRQAMARLFFLALEAGVTVELEPDQDELHRIVAANQGNPKHPVFLAPPNDRQYCRLAPDNFMVTVGRDRSGRAVTLNTAKLVDLRHRSLADTFADLTFYYDDPERHAEPGDAVISGAEAPRLIVADAFAVYSGTLWRHTDLAGLHAGEFKISQITGRLLRLAALAYWVEERPEWFFSLTWARLVEAGVLANVGYSRYEGGIDLHCHGKGLPMVLNYMDRAELVADAELVGAGVLHRPQPLAAE
ncbi:MAG: hypothetical protein HYR63_14110 [Proteobacteria bacterium]|nr:hypothetical protein [Pseudomonadota bacterium]